MVAAKLQTLERGIEALFLIARSDDGLKIAELAERLGVNRAIAYRLAGTLIDHGLVQRLAGGRLVMGGAAIALAAQIDRNMRAIVRPILKKLAEETLASAFVSLAQGDDYVAIATAESEKTLLSVYYRVGVRHPIHRGAPGIAILSSRPPHPDDTEQVQKARRDGFAFTRGELQPGAVGIAGPVILPRARERGLEFSIGVVALDDLDIDKARHAVIKAAAQLADHLKNTALPE